MKGNRRGGPPGAGVEKAKDFKSAIKRLIKELHSFKILIVVALFLAAIGSILSIFTPNILSDLTDEISAGLVIRQDHLEELSKRIGASLEKNTIVSKMSEIMNVDLSNQNIKNIMMNKDITDSDKEIFQDVLESVNVEDISMDMFSKLPSSILNLLFSDSTYNGVLIRTEDKIRLLNMEQDVRRLPESVLKALLIEIEIDHVKISVDDQIVFLNKMGTLKKDAEVEEVYAIIDDLPKSIKKVVEPFMNLDKIKDIALFLVLLYVLSALFTYIESISMTTVSNHFARILRRRISRKINKLPLKYFDKNSTGDILSRVTNDVDTLAQTMNQSLATLVSAITLFLGTIIMMFLTNYLMAITAILSSLFGFVFMFIVLGKSQKYFTAKQEELGHLNGHIEEVYSGLNVVKAYNGKEISSLKFQELNKKMYEANRKSQFLSSLMMPMMNFIGNFGYVAVCIVGALLTMDNKISFGVIVAFISYVRLFTSPLAQIAQAFTNLQSAAAASERVFEFIDEEEMIKEENKKYLEKEKVKGDIEFKNVVFQYDGTDHPTIKNFTASAKSGEKIAIVGPTGAGKTTMVNLLMKFYELTGGDIKIDGVSTKELTRENIHSLFTMVLQDTWLFDGTIKENIAYNRDHVTEEHIKEVCKTVGLDHFIRTLPNGYDSYVSDNDSVSAEIGRASCRERVCLQV